jgi:hypothetical protein
MSDHEAVIQDVKDAHVIALNEMMRCAKNQPINNMEDVKTAQAFLTILQAYYKEQMDVLKAIKDAGSIINDKLRAYNGPKEESIEDL